MKMDNKFTPPEIHHKLLHLKYKIKKRDLQQDQQHLVKELIREKRQTLQDDYSEEAILNNSWLVLKKAIVSPVYGLQDMYFDFILKKAVSEEVGEEFAGFLEEILRDEVVTKHEKKFIFEKAAEFGLKPKKIENILQEYTPINLAFRKIIYEVCKDGVITEAEQNYLIEKARQYNIPKQKVLFEINQIEHLCSQIHSLFKHESFYNIILFLYLIRFFNHQSNSIVSFLQNIYFLVKGDKIEEKKILLILKSLKANVVTYINCENDNIEIVNENDNIDKILLTLGLNKLSHNDVIEEYCTKKHSPVTIDNILSSLDKTYDHEAVDPNSENHFKLGTDEYELVYVNQKNHPLFSFDTIGNKTIVRINQGHYFFRDKLHFKLAIISMVANLRKNYAKEDLIEDIQYLLNPPAIIRIKFPKEIKK